MDFEGMFLLDNVLVQLVIGTINMSKIAIWYMTFLNVAD